MEPWTLELHTTITTAFMAVYSVIYNVPPLLYYPCTAAATWCLGQLMGVSKCGSLAPATCCTVYHLQQTVLMQLAALVLDLMAESSSAKHKGLHTHKYMCARIAFLTEFPESLKVTTLDRIPLW